MIKEEMVVLFNFYMVIYYLYYNWNNFKNYEELM